MPGERRRPAPWYSPTAVPAALDRYLACSWTAVPTGRHRLVPDGCIDVLWVSTGALIACGPETTAWDFELPPGTTAVGVRFLPGAGAPLLGVPCSSITDRRVPLDEIVGADIAAGVLDNITAQPSPDRRRAVLERFAVGLIARNADRAREDLEFADVALNALAAAPHATAATLAQTLGMSVRQLHRRSRRVFGYGTSVLARLLRLQRVLSVVAGNGAGRTPGLAELAARAGYTDQAHFSRDCRAITGCSPTEFLRDSFPTFPDMADPYKTEIALADTA